ncbi:MAG: hypothetical protein JW779_10765 [Candidatus Thorarchaeota archaeon]|nr:hypothetical protein [Candidatus Thorarchaeota archaeon]
MKVVEFDSEFDNRVLDYLGRNYSKIFSKRWIAGNRIVAIFVHEEYVLRTSSNQSITVIFESSGMSGMSRVTVIASGGGQGLFGITWGSESAAENTFEKRIREITTGRYDSQY